MKNETTYLQIHTMPCEILNHAHTFCMATNIKLQSIKSAEAFVRTNQLGLNCQPIVNHLIKCSMLVICLIIGIHIYVHELIFEIVTHVNILVSLIIKNKGHRMV